MGGELRFGSAMCSLSYKDGWNASGVKRLAPVGSPAATFGFRPASTTGMTV